MVEEQRGREPSEKEDQAGINGFVATREDVSGTSLEESQLLDNGLDLRSDLGATGTGPDNSYSLAREIVVVSPF